MVVSLVSPPQTTPRLRLHGHIELEESPEEVGVTRTDPPLPIVFCNLDLDSLRDMNKVAVIANDFDARGGGGEGVSICKNLFKKKE